jgi:hypothetical protein
MYYIHLINAKTNAAISFEMDREEYERINNAEHLKPHIKEKYEYEMMVFHEEKEAIIKGPAAILINLYKERNPQSNGNNTYYIVFEEINNEKDYEIQYSSASHKSFSKSAQGCKHITNRFKITNYN